MRKTRVFATGSLWSLLIYLVYNDLKDIKRTHYFFLNPGIHNSIRKNFKCVTLNHNKLDKLPWRLIQLFFITSPLLYRIRWPYLWNADIHCIDQGSDMRAIIGRNRYTLIEDGIGDYNKSRIVEDKYNTKLFRWLFGPIYAHDFGNNSLCKKYILTMPPIDDVMIEKGEQIDIKQLWEASPADKKDFILRCFNIDASDVDKMKSRDTILLTQPLSEDKVYSEQEKIRIYQEMVESYGEENIIIKPHPREKTDYSNHFPKAIVFDKVVPMQLFSLLGVKFNNAVTISSTAAVSLKQDGVPNIDFKGTDKFPELAKVYGHINL